jgi:hypothetical protein
MTDNSSDGLWRKQYPDFEARDEAKRQRELKNMQEFRVETETLNNELRALGYEIETVYDLSCAKTARKSAVPILLNHLEKQYSWRVFAAICQALTVKDARTAWVTIVNIYKNLANFDGGKDNTRKDWIANLIAFLVWEKTWDEYIELIRDKRNGTSRILLLGKILRSKRPERDQLLDEFSNDPELAIEINDKRKRKASQNFPKIIH